MLKHLFAALWKICNNLYIFYFKCIDLFLFGTQDQAIKEYSQRLEAAEQSANHLAHRQSSHLKERINMVKFTPFQYKCEEETQQTFLLQINIPGHICLCTSSAKRVFCGLYKSSCLKKDTHRMQALYKSKVVDMSRPLHNFPWWNITITFKITQSIVLCPIKNAPQIHQSQ